MEYQEHIASTEQRCTFLHRTSKTLVDSIMQEGLTCGEDLLSTATAQSQELEHAKNLYRLTHKGSDAVVVIHIPREKITKANMHSLGTTNRIGYFHPVRKYFTIRPEFVTGWIDRTNDEYHPNPYPDRQPVKGFEQFEHLFE